MPAFYAHPPLPRDSDPFFQGDLRRLSDDDVMALLASQIGETVALLGTLSEVDAAVRYAPGKWSVKQVVGHMIDVERVFVHRALCISRNDLRPLPGFDQEEYMTAAGFDDRLLAHLTDELSAVRAATVLFFGGLSNEAMHRLGRANDWPLSVRAAAHIIAGHERHHVAVLRDRYLPLLH